VTTGDKWGTTNGAQRETLGRNRRKARLVSGRESSTGITPEKRARAKS